MSGGGVAFSQTLQSQDETNMGSGEPVVRYGTGGRITGFANGGNVDSRGIRHFLAGGDDGLSLGVVQDGGFDSSYDGFGDNYDGFDYDRTGPTPDGAFIDFGGNDDDIPEIVNTPGPVVTETEEISEIIITTDRPTQTPFDTFTLTDTVTYFTETDSEEISEIIITTDRPTKTPVVTDTEEISEIIITTDRPTKTPVVTETDTDEISEIIITTDRPTRTPVVTETDTEEISEIIITTDRPTPTPTVTITLTVTDTVTYVTETDTEEVSEIIITTDRPTPTPTVTITLTVTDTITYVTETDTEEISEIIITTDRPTPTPTVTVTFTFTDTDTITVVTETDTETDTETVTVTETVTETYTPRPTLPPITQTPRPTTTPVPTNTPVPRQGIYRSQYQNYANPLTMFNASNYGQDVPTSAGYKYAAKNQGIDALNQNLRDMAARQIAQKYPDGSPKGADMDAVLREMRAVGLTPTDLENAYYGRTTGLNTPFSVYAKNPAIQTPFSFTDVQQPQKVQAPQTVQQKQVAMSNGIFDLIKKLPK